MPHDVINLVASDWIQEFEMLAVKEIGIVTMDGRKLYSAEVDLWKFPNCLCC